MFSERADGPSRNWPLYCRDCTEASPLLIDGVFGGVMPLAFAAAHGGSVVLALKAAACRVPGTAKFCLASLIRVSKFSHLFLCVCQGPRVPRLSAFMVGSAHVRVSSMGRHSCVIVKNRGLWWGTDIGWLESSKTFLRLLCGLSREGLLGVLSASCSLLRACVTLDASISMSVCCLHEPFWDYLWDFALTKNDQIRHPCFCEPGLVGTSG